MEGLWLATTDNIFVYDGKAFSVLTNNGKRLGASTIMEDRNGNIWLSGAGLWRYDGSSFTNFIQDAVLAICEDKNGNIWTSSNGKPSDQNWILSRYNGSTLNNKNPVVTEIKHELGAIFTILEANDGRIWLGADGVYRYDGETIQDFKGKERRDK